MPVFWIERIAVSRPEPGPFTITSTRRTPCSIAFLAAASAASCAANGVLLRLPLKPTLPELAHEMALPCRSVMVTIVLLNDDLMCTTPYATFLRSRRFGRRPPAAGRAISDLPREFVGYFGRGLGVERKDAGRRRSRGYGEDEDAVDRRSDPPKCRQNLRGGSLNASSPSS